MVKLMLNLFRKSLPKSSIVCGVEIKKLPLGAYLDAIDSIKNLPELLLNETFPGLTTQEIIDRFKKLDEKMFFVIISNLLVQVPEQSLRFIAKLIDCEYDRLRNDPEIGLNGIKTILMEFWKVNDMSSFFADVLEALAKLPALQKIMNIGSKT